MIVCWKIVVERGDAAVEKRWARMMVQGWTRRDTKTSIAPVIS